MENVTASRYDQAKDMKEFQEAKAGVKGLVDSGIPKVPRMFIHDEKSIYRLPTNNNLQVPVIDFKGLLEQGEWMEIVDQIRRASETWGFFQVINHGIPNAVMDEMLECHKKFHEQPADLKEEYYLLDRKQSVKFYSNVNTPESQPATWRDSLTVSFRDDILDPSSLPSICRESILSYINCLFKLRETVSELLSEALGLSRDYLSKLECMKGGNLMCHYHPICPEPHLTLGAHRHSDPDFLTILLQDEVGGLQVLYQNQWVDVPPTRGALTVNIGDLMQLITNDKFKSVEHRVLVKSNGPRLSVACAFYQSSANSSKLYGPLKELVSSTNPPIYREILTSEYLSLCTSKWMEEVSVLTHFKL